MVHFERPLTLEAGKKRLEGDTLREANSDEVNHLRKENNQLKHVVADLVLKKPQIPKAHSPSVVVVLYDCIHFVEMLILLPSSIVILLGFYPAGCSGHKAQTSPSAVAFCFNVKQLIHQRCVLLLLIFVDFYKVLIFVLF